MSEAATAAAGSPNPLPTEPFSGAEAARRTWPALLESMLDAVCLVEPEGLRIVAANRAAARLHGVDAGELVGRDMRASAPTPEDECFWSEVAAGLGTDIVSDSFVLHAGGAALPVTRRVARVEPAPGAALYVVTLRDRSDELRRQRAADIAAAELQATLESVNDGVLVADLAGRISRFNRRFAALWRLPDEVLLLGDDDEVYDWMRHQVDDPAGYAARLAGIALDPGVPATDFLRLVHGDVLERVAMPQKSRGRLVGQVFSYRLLAAESR